MFIISKSCCIIDLRSKFLAFQNSFLVLRLLDLSKKFSLCQRKYVLDILEDAGYLGCKPAPTLLEQHLKLSKMDGELLDDHPSSFRRLVGRLLCLTHTRPDLSHSVHLLSQFMYKPQVPHLAAAHRVEDTSNLVQIKGCFIQLYLISHLRHFVILIGLVVQIVEGLSLDFAFSLVLHLLHGNVSSKAQSPDHLPNLSIGLWLLRVLRFNSFHFCCKIFVCLSPKLFSCSMITKLLCTSLPTPLYTNVLSTST